MDDHCGWLEAGLWLMTSCPFPIRGSGNMLSSYWDRAVVNVGGWVVSSPTSGGWILPLARAVVSVAHLLREQDCHCRWRWSSWCSRLEGANLNHWYILPFELCFHWVRLIFHYLMSLSRFSLLEEVNDSDIPMEPLHYQVAPPVVEQQLRRCRQWASTAKSATQAAADAEREGSLQASGQLIGQMNTKAHGWTWRYVRIQVYNLNFIMQLWK